MKKIANLAIVFSLFLYTAAVAGEECRQDQIDLRWSGGNTRFTVEIADTVQARARGLMHRNSLPQFSGMLFIYPQPNQVSFWMKNTLIPLDMLFLDQSGTVKRIAAQAQPGDLRPIHGGPDISQVLEINGGLAAMLGIAPGAEMRHPSLNQTQAAWPCN